MSEREIFFRRGACRLAGSSFGDLDRPAVLLLHGAGQTRHAWRRAGEAIAANSMQAISLDARGHGGSDWAPDGDYSIDTLIADLRHVVRELGQLPFIVGASLGGITALLAQGESDEMLFRALVLVDITPRIDRAGVERIIEFMRAHAGGFESIEAAALAVAQYQPHRRNDTGALDGLRKNLRRRGDRYYWHWDPELLNHISELDLQSVDRMRDAARQLTLPTLLVHGKMSEIVSDETAREFLELVPHAQYVDVKDAAHMVAGDSNDRFNAAVLTFLAQCQSGELPTG